MTPLNVMFHELPEGRPVSVNVTVYLTSENETDLETGLAFTIKEPVDGDGS